MSGSWGWGIFNKRHSLLEFICPAGLTKPTLFGLYGILALLFGILYGILSLVSWPFSGGVFWRFCNNYCGQRVHGKISIHLLPNRSMALVEAMPLLPDILLTRSHGENPSRSCKLHEPLLGFTCSNLRSENGIMELDDSCVPIRSQRASALWNPSSGDGVPCGQLRPHSTQIWGWGSQSGHYY